MHEFDRSQLASFLGFKNRFELQHLEEQSQSISPKSTSDKGSQIATLATETLNPKCLSDLIPNLYGGGRSWEDSSYSAPSFSSFASRRTATLGMDLPSSRYSPGSQLREPNAQSTNMSTLAIQPSPALPSKNMHWEDTRQLELNSRPRSPLERTEKVNLPSIRQTFPEIQLRAGGAIEPEIRADPNSYSPTAGPGFPTTPPEYYQSPSLHKRRKLSTDDDNDPESRARIVPRIYRSLRRVTRPQNAAVSPITSRRASAFSPTESWSRPARTSPYVPAQRVTEVRSPPQFDPTNINRAEWRPALPQLPSLTFERGQTQVPRRSSNWSEYALEATRSGAQPYSQLSPPFDPPSSSYNPNSFSYSYQHPSGQSYSGPSPGLDRNPFSAGSHHPGYPGGIYPYGVEINDGSDGKQRKRRGNLPKETTDKLRAWFVAHLQHPYPTEDEKQDLMRQTGLQMNQISNWFINARRRQLPAMINNARAESDARSARVCDRDGGTSDYGDEREKTGGPPHLGDSDGDGSGYDEDYDQVGAPRNPIQDLPK